ncbi:hypothetical protein MVEN_00185500 [Mycena venus]|uniref:Uncharacterized protein n=1 Tax=Mycena venus TaxID=2733690 RepID=A0A8H6Z2D3_9AGAR|nr:hypothetical protein MVEN_00185500 [Mycena venus]
MRRPSLDGLARSQSRIARVPRDHPSRRRHSPLVVRAPVYIFFGYMRLRGGTRPSTDLSGIAIHLLALHVHEPRRTSVFIAMDTTALVIIVAGTSPSPPPFSPSAGRPAVPQARPLSGSRLSLGRPFQVISALIPKAFARRLPYFLSPISLSLSIALPHSRNPLLTLIMSHLRTTHPWSSRRFGLRCGGEWEADGCVIVCRRLVGVVTGASRGRACASWPMGRGADARCAADDCVIAVRRLGDVVTRASACLLGCGARGGRLLCARGRVPRVLWALLRRSHAGRWTIRAGINALDTILGPSALRGTRCHSIS